MKPKTLSLAVLVLVWCFLFRPSLGDCEIEYFSDDTGYWRLEDYITTHYTSETGDDKKKCTVDPYEIDETGVLELYYGADADDTWMNREKDGFPFYDSEDPKRPYYNNYFNQATAGKPVSRSVIEGFHDELYGVVQKHVDILNYDPDTPFWSYVFYNMPNVQIINNIPHGNSLFTVVLPPEWKWDTPTRYPVLLRGAGYLSDNNGIYDYEKNPRAFERIKWVANSVDIGPGLIAVFSNAGGRESQGVHSNAFDDVGSFLNLLTNFPVWPGGGGQMGTINLGADLTKIITDGGSRGGATALAWGVKLAEYNCDVLGIHASVPPLKLGSMLRRSFFSFPGLNNAVNEALGSDNAYLYTYPDEQALTPDEKALAVGDVFVGGVDFNNVNVEEEIDKIDGGSAYGISANAKSSLKAKRVSISMGTHDAYTSMADFLDFDHMLNESDPDPVPHKTYIGYMWGHGFVDRPGFYDPVAQKWHTDTYVSIYKVLQGQDFQPYVNQRIFEMPDCERWQDTDYYCKEPTGVDWEKPLRINSGVITRIQAIHSDDALWDYFPIGHDPSLDPSKLGFSATIPAKAVKDLPVTVVLMGESGKSYEIYARPENGYHPVYEASGTFDANEYVIMQYEISDPEGRYEWFFKYDGKEIPNRFTSFRRIVLGFDTGSLTDVQDTPTKGDKLWLWTGPPNSIKKAYGTLVGYEVSNGSWSEDNAEGNFYLLEEKAGNWSAVEDSGITIERYNPDDPDNPDLIATTTAGETLYVTFEKCVTEILTDELVYDCTTESLNDPVGYYNDYSFSFYGKKLTNFGVDEYHVLLLAKNQDPVVEDIPNQRIDVGQTLNLTFTAMDPDGADDDLVYDVRNIAGNLYNTTVNLNGTTGEFSFTPKPAHSRKTFRATAIAKDGKGGRGEKHFYICVDKPEDDPCP